MFFYFIFPAPFMMTMTEPIFLFILPTCCMNLSPVWSILRRACCCCCRRESPGGRTASWVDGWTTYLLQVRV
ncbi:hypothetical protein F4775DRAFT_578668 [Biscogniauxia sp. FL1348]|nr:hypothetical protein F4775DRAFT_578668 [Biscogniauxia sp. FL1348]